MRSKHNKYKRLCPYCGVEDIPVVARDRDTVLKKEIRLASNMEASCCFHCGYILEKNRIGRRSEFPQQDNF